ncbi:MAG: ribosome biogenesis GTPase Der [bacterium]
MKPVVSIIGRPNTGKSTLFNRLIGKRKALVSKLSGFTRDRNYGDTSFLGKDFTVVDTGGWVSHSEEDLIKDVKHQTELAVSASDIVLFMVDGREGINPVDIEIAHMLRKVRKKVILVVNKMDNDKHMENMFDFYKLGIGEPIGISADHGLNIDMLLDGIMEHIPANEEGPDEDLTKIAVIGAPNVGKSSLVNALLREERVIVDKEPGTTRDAIDTFFHRENDRFILIDTAGIRHRGTVHKSLELLSFLSAQRSMERADIALLVLDASRELTEQEERIAGLASQAGCACIILINKWDLIAQKFPHTDKVYRHEIQRRFKFLHYAPVLFTSAKTRHGIHRIIPYVTKVMKNYTREVEAGDLKKILGEAIDSYPAPLYKGRRVSVGELAQIKIKPPSFTLNVSEWRALHFSYKRYIENKLRDHCDFTGTPIKLSVRGKKKAGK